MSEAGGNNPGPHVSGKWGIGPARRVNFRRACANVNDNEMKNPTKNYKADRKAVEPRRLGIRVRHANGLGWLPPNMRHALTRR